MNVDRNPISDPNRINFDYIERFNKKEEVNDKTIYIKRNGKLGASKFGKAMAVVEKFFTGNDRCDRERVKKRAVEITQTILMKTPNSEFDKAKFPLINYLHKVADAAHANADSPLRKVDDHQKDRTDMVSYLSHPSSLQGASLNVKFTREEADQIIPFLVKEMLKTRCWLDDNVFRSPGSNERQKLLLPNFQLEARKKDANFSLLWANNNGVLENRDGLLIGSLIKAVYSSSKPPSGAATNALKELFKKSLYDPEAKDGTKYGFKDNPIGLIKAFPDAEELINQCVEEHNNPQVRS